jgi:hypothetical protein
MTTATLDTAAPQTAPQADASTAAPTTAAERRSAAALRRATDDAANAARTRRQDRIAFGALILGLVISLGTFGLVAYDGSMAQGTPTSVSTAP